MRPLRALGLYTLMVFLGGALLAPWVYWLVQWLGRTFPDLANDPFGRYVGTTMLIVALAGLWPWLRAMGASSFREVGLVNPIGHGREFGAGLLLGLCSLSVLGGIALVFGVREFDTRLTAGRFAREISGAVLTAAGVAVIEETLFRGGVFGGLRRVFQWPFALLLSSMIYSVTHFFEDAKHFGEVTWLSGAQLLPHMFGGGATFAEGLPRFLNLTLAGLLLGLAYQRKGNLWFSIGLHAGWIFCLVTYRTVSRTLPGTANWFWGSGKLIDGWLAFLVLGITLACLARFLPQNRHARMR